MIDAKFIKIMGLTTSSSDGEALSAIRKANAILKEKNMSWEEVFFAPKVQRSTIPEQDIAEMVRAAHEKGFREGKAWKPETRKYEYDLDSVSTWDMIREVKSSLQARGQTEPLSFIESLEAGYVKFGSLTPRQQAALKKFYENAMKFKNG